MTFKATLDRNRYLERHDIDFGDDRRLHRYSRGELIPLKAQGIWQVCQGIVKLSASSADGEEVLLGLAGPSTPFGPSLTCLEAYQATALSNVCLLQFSVAEIEASPDLTQTLFPPLTRRLQQTEALLAILGLRLVKDRLRRLLLLLKQEFGQPVAEGTRLSVRLSHESLANLISTSRVTITRQLSQFKQEGWITSDRLRHLIIRADHE